MAINPTGIPGVQIPQTTNTNPGFPPPGVDPSIFFIPASSSFFLQILLFDANKVTTPVNVGPIPPDLGIPAWLLGGPFIPQAGARDVGGFMDQISQNSFSSPFDNLGGNNFSGFGSPFGGNNFSDFSSPFGGNNFSGSGSPFGGNNLFNIDTLTRSIF